MSAEPRIRRSPEREALRELLEATEPYERASARYTASTGEWWAYTRRLARARRRAQAALEQAK